MPCYELRFEIPERQLGQPEPYKAFGRTVDRLLELGSSPRGSVRVEEVHVTGGSLFGSATITADSYQSALGLVCRETPIVHLQWHLEEEVSPAVTAALLSQALELADSEAEDIGDDPAEIARQMTSDLGHSMGALDLARASEVPRAEPMPMLNGWRDVDVEEAQRFFL